MDKDVGKIGKNDNTDIIIRIDDFGGKRGLTIREFTKSERYTGFTKSGTRIPVEKFLEFREIINSINLEELNAPVAPSEGKAKKEDNSAVEDY
jgi:hypothetical protein